jgi:hypothetical protein
MSPTRRQYLAALASTAALAGCSSDGTTTTPTATDSAPTTSTRIGTTTPSTTATPVVPTTTAGTSTTTQTQTTPAPTTTTVDTGALRAEARRFVRQLAAGEYQAAIDTHDYTDEVSGQLDATALENAWVTATGDLGSFTAIAGTEYGQQSEYSLVVVSAQFTGGQQLVQFTFDGQGRIAGLFFPAQQGSWSAPDYAEESAFTETEVSLPAGDCSLGGTLTLPTGESQVPGAVLVHGSGPADRDETVGPNKPFKDLAWGLATEGIAVLRYDKRTAACEVDLAALGVDGVVTDDALTALDRLRDHERVREDATTVLGHSLGGMLAPRIAQRDDALAAVGMLAAPARPIPTLVLEQVQYLLELDGDLSAADQERLEAVREEVRRIRELSIPEGETVRGHGRAFWADLADYDQVAAAQSLSLPRYLVHGGRDYQVTDTDLDLWREALSGRESVTIDTYDDLNHLLMPGTGQPQPTEYFRANSVDEGLVTALADWMASTTGQ